MNLLNVFILGIVEGLTEFLPVSSTAHLILTSYFLKIPQTEFQKLFEVVIQSGAILAVLFVYLKYLIKNKFLWVKIFLSFIPTAFVGLVFYEIIKDIFFNSLTIILFSLFLLGLFFIFTEMLIKKEKIILTKSLLEMNLWEALIIGLCQSFAIIPGVSRAGIVILTMLFLRFKRKESAIYSFLLALPTIFAASIYDLYKNRQLFFEANIFYLTMGFFTSFIFAWISIKWFIIFLQKKTLTPFGWYRIALALLIFFSLFIRRLFL